MEAQNSRASTRSARIRRMGRPRKRPPGTSTTLSFWASDELIAALDEAAERLSAKRPAGQSRLSRGDLVRTILHEWLAAQPKPRQ